jgi:hypothetical protein
MLVVRLQPAKVVTVNATTTPPTPGAGTISGASTVCVGATTAY